MTWVRLDDKMPRHPKVGALSDAAFRAWVEGLCYSAEYLTDGHLPTVFLRQVKPRTQTELVANGLWEANGNGVHVHDFLDFQPSRTQVTELRSGTAQRQALHRDPDLKQLVRERDGDRCRYCGVQVNWKARRGPAAGTFDHVDPRGGNSAANVVVACRGCNSRKACRTPAEAGMHLVRIHTGDPDAI